MQVQTIKICVSSTRKKLWANKKRFVVLLTTKRKMSLVFNISDFPPHLLCYGLEILITILFYEDDQKVCGRPDFYNLSDRHQTTSISDDHSMPLWYLIPFFFIAFRTAVFTKNSLVISKLIVHY